MLIFLQILLTTAIVHLIEQVFAITKTAIDITTIIKRSIAKYALVVAIKSIDHFVGVTAIAAKGIKDIISTTGDEEAKVIMEAVVQLIIIGIIEKCLEPLVKDEIIVIMDVLVTKFTKEIAEDLVRE